MEKNSEGLKEFRKSLNNIDDKIVLLLAKRTSLAHDIATYKLSENLSRLDSKREKEVMERVVGLGKKNGLSGEFVKDMFTCIIKESHKIQREIMKK